MNDIIMNYAGSANTGDAIQFALNMGVALILSMFIMLLYRLTYTGTAFSKRFMVSIAMLTIVTAMIMNVISDNVALSLGLVGALSIVRFRTAVKDARDTTFIFWAVGVGICCGVSMYAQAAIGSLFVMLFLAIFGKTRADGTYLLVVRGTSATQSAAESAVTAYFSGKAKLKVRNSSTRQSDLIYEISARNVEAAASKRAISIADALLKIEGVESVDLVQQTDDITR